MVTINNSAPGDKLSLSIIEYYLLNKEVYRKEMGANIDQALVINGGSK